MKILHCGNHRPDHSTETHHRKTLERLGHKVIAIQEDETSSDKILRLADEHAPDLFLYTRTWAIKGDPIGMYRQLESRGIPTVAVHLDLYYGLQRGSGLQTDPFWKTKYCFTPDGSPKSAEFFKAHGVNHFYLKPGVFAPECYMAEPVKEYQSDVIFVGAYFYHPEWNYRPQLIDWLKNTYGPRFRKYGNEEGTYRGHSLNQVYASAKVAVGDSLVLGFTHAKYWSDRLYECGGRFGFQIFPRIAGIEEEFTDGENIVLYEFENFAQLRKLIDYYIENDAERERIRRNYHEFVKNNCTYDHRLREMFSILAEHEPSIREKLKQQ